MWEMIFLALFWGVQLFHLFGFFLGKKCMPCVIPSFYQSHSKNNKPWCVWISILFKSLSHSILHHSSFELPELMIIPNMVVSINGGTQKWMVSVRTIPSRNGWFGGTPSGNLHMLDTCWIVSLLNQSSASLGAIQVTALASRIVSPQDLVGSPPMFSQSMEHPKKKDREGHSYKTY